MVRFLSYAICISQCSHLIFGKPTKLMLVLHQPPCNLQINLMHLPEPICFFLAFTISLRPWVESTQVSSRVKSSSVLVHSSLNMWIFRVCKLFKLVPFILSDAAPSSRWIFTVKISICSADNIFRRNFEIVFTDLVLIHSISLIFFALFSLSLDWNQCFFSKMNWFSAKILTSVLALFRNADFFSEKKYRLTFFDCRIVN